MRDRTKDYSGRLRAAEWLVGDCPLDRARSIVVRHHYARGAANTATYCHGLWRRSDMWLAGVAWWMPPTRGAAASFWPDPAGVLNLSRLVIVPGVPKNAATFLLMRSVRLVGPAWPCLVTYADTGQNHDGGIYRCAGWEYLGLGKPERCYVNGGVMVSRKAGPKTRTHAAMLALGAECVGSFAKHRFRLVRKVRQKAVPPDGQGFLFPATAGQADTDQLSLPRRPVG